MSSVVGVDPLTLAPVLAPAIGAVLVLVLDLVFPRAVRLHLAVALAALGLGALAALARLGGWRQVGGRTLCQPGSGTRCSYLILGSATTLQLVALFAAAVTVLLAWPAARSQPAGRTAVYASLLLGATTGATAVAAVRDLGSWLVSIELATLPVVALVALGATRRAVDGAVALLTTSLVSFAMLVMGAACWYAATGSAYFSASAAASVKDVPHHTLLVLGVLLIVGGIGFKLSLVPFHAWTPVSYAGGPLPVAAFLAATSKVAALAALLVVLGAAVPLGGHTVVAVAVVSAVSMTLGNLLALRQQDTVRLLAFSTVAQAGWVVLPLCTLRADANQAASGYLAAYLIATVLVFAVVALLVQRYGPAARALAGQRGLFGTHPVIAGALAFGLLSLAGLPPGVLGLVAKVFALRPVVEGSVWWLAVVAAVNAMLGVAVYLRWLAVLITGTPGNRRTGRHPAGRSWHPAQLFAFGLTLTALVVASADPQLVLGTHANNLDAPAVVRHLDQHRTAGHLLAATRLPRERR